MLHEAIEDVTEDMKHFWSVLITCTGVEKVEEEN